MTVTTAPELTGTWTGDVTHTELAFKARHMGVGRAGGIIPLQEATLTFGDQGIANGSVVVLADATRVQTNNEQRDNHVKSDDFLNVAAYPTITFRSTGVRDFDGETFQVDGELTIRDITRPLTLHAELLGALVDASGTPRIGFAATGTLNRKDYGVKFGPVFGIGNAVVSDVVTLSIEAEFTQQGE